MYLIDRLEPRKLLAAVTFDIDRASSRLTIDAEIDVDKVGDVDLDPQEDGLDTAALTGTLVANVTAQGIRFSSGNAIRVAETAGAFSPGDAPAAYAVDGKVKKLGITLAKVNAAFRDITFDLSNTSRGKVDKKSKQFDVKNATLSTTEGHVDYVLDSKFGDADGEESLAGLSSRIARAKGKLTGGAGSRAITVPVNVSFEREIDGGTVAFTITGRIVGRERVAAQAVAASFSTQSIVKRNVDDILA